MAEAPIKMGIEVTADTSKVKQQLAQTAGEVNATGAAAADKATEATKKQEAATSELGEKLKGVKKTYGEQIEVVQGLLGKVFAVGAIATTFYKIGESISTYVIARLQTAKDNMEAFRQTLDKTNTKASQLAIADKFDELNRKLYETEAQFRPLTNLILKYMPEVGGIIADDANKIREELKGLSDIAKATSNNVTRIRDKAAEEADAKERERRSNLVEQLNELNTKAIIDGLGEEEKIVAEAEQKILEIRKAFNALAQADRLAQVESTQAAIRSIEDQAIAEIQKRRQEAADAAAKKAEEERKKEEEWWDKIREWQREQEEAERKRAEAAAKARDAWVQSLKAIRAEINATFGADTANSITQFGQQIQGLGMVTSANMNRIVVEGVG